jgi:hypothetical protein
VQGCTRHCICGCGLELGGWGDDGSGSAGRHRLGLGVRQAAQTKRSASGGGLADTLERLGTRERVMEWVFAS